MAIYKAGTNVVVGTGNAFESEHSPGTEAPYAGIYACVSCGDEIGIAKGHVLPAQNHAQHAPGLGAIRWKCLVYAQQKS